MSATIIDGKQIAAAMRADIKKQVSGLQEKGIVPGLAVILVGEDPASQSYVKGKEKACAEAGIYSDDNRISADVSEEELIALVEEKNADPAIHGILVQLPLPGHINESRVIRTVLPEKDVDGFHPVNVGKMVLGEKAFLACTPHGIVKMLEISGVQTPGKHVVVVGRSNIVGKPVANILLQKAPNANATVTVCHTGTADMAAHTRQADILIVAAGRPEVVTADMIKPGAIVIDVGVNRVDDASRPRGYRLVGDVDFDAASEVASMITPVPGGVGPMTITMLLYNTLESAKLHAGIA